jgi:NtrC-family two-component system sensor histidine kinase KinB
VKVFPVEKEDGAQLAYVILLEDVTKLKELDQLKSDFVSIASHELRTPLTSIIMSLGMVSDGTAGPLNDDQKELLAAAYEDAERMRHLMTSLLDISRIETGRVDMDMAPVSPGGIVEEISNSFKIQAQEKGVELFTRVPEGLPSVQADRSRILQVLTNLITNALRYTPAGGSITVSASSREGYVVFTVADTGRGIPRDYLKKIFRKFVQVANDPNPGGAGLGLALCHEIVKAHNGNIWVESEMDRGSRFMFTLPISTPF